MENQGEAILFSLLFCAAAVPVMLIPALVAAYGEQFVDIVSATVRAFFLPIIWPVMKIYSLFVTKELTPEDSSAK